MFALFVVSLQQKWFIGALPTNIFICIGKQEGVLLLLLLRALLIESD